MEDAMMVADAPLVVFLDKQLRMVSDYVQPIEVDATVHHLRPAHAAVTVPAAPDVMAALAVPGRRVALIYRQRPFVVGPLERPHGAYRRSARGGEYARPGKVTFHFTDYLALIVGRHVYPDPSSPWSDQSGAEHYTATGTASTVLRDLVNVQAGPGAHTSPDRRVTGLVMGADPVVGPAVTIRGRFDSLGDAMRSVVTHAGGAIAYRAVADLANRQVVFEIYETADLSDRIRFAWQLGNVLDVTFDTEIPRATAALVAGQGEGTARTTIERVDAAAEADHDRIESFIDQRNTDVTAELQAAGDEHLAENGAAATLVTEAVDTPDQQFGVHFQLGDSVSYEPIEGVSLVDIVRGAHLTYKPDEGAVLSTIIGSQSQTRDPEWLRQYRRVSRQLGILQAR